MRKINIISLWVCGVLFFYGLSLTHAQNESLPCLNKKFLIVTHIVKDSLVQANITEQDIKTAVAQLNTDFNPICVSFEICEFRYIDNFQYDSLVIKNEFGQLITEYHDSSRINLFYVDKIVDKGFPPGYATFDGIGKNSVGGVVCTKTSVTLRATLSHEMGHFFGLENTFKGSGIELVDGGNCTTKGDKICDTPADPYVDGDPPSMYVDNTCRFISMKKDANGDYYTPEVGNIMSNYPDACICSFSNDQFKKMVESYLNSNPKLW